MILHVMDDSFSYKGRIENYRSLRWKEQYQGKGSFALIVDDTEQNAAMLQRGRILFRGDRKTAMLIIKITRKTADNTIQVYGYTTLSFLERRVIQGPYTVSNVENGIRLMYEENRRNLPIDLTESANFDDVLEEKQEINDAPMLDTFLELCKDGDIGIKVDCDYRQKKQTLKLYKGRDLSYKDGTGGMVFSVEFGNMLNVTVEEDDWLFKNICYVRGKKKNGDEILLEIGETEDGQRREMIINGSAQEDDQSDDDYISKLEQEAKKVLQENYDVTNFIAEISPEKFGKSYDLGDLVTCNATRYGVRFNARITEFEDLIEQGFRRVNITMGEPTITYAKAILAQAKK